MLIMADCKIPTWQHQTGKEHALLALVSWYWLAPAYQWCIRDTFCATLDFLGSGRSSGEGNGNPLQYCCMEISADIRAWWGIWQATVQRVTKSQTWLEWLHFHVFFLKLFSYLLYYRILNSVPCANSRSLFTILNVVVCICQPYNFLSLCGLVWFLY